MKRGKRQVIQAQPQNSTQDSTQQEQPLHYFQTLPQPQISQPQPQSYTTIIKQKPTSQQAIIPKPLPVVQPSIKYETQSKLDEAEQKRKKIQMLKQKYLKKNKPQEPKSIPQVQSHPVQPLTQHQPLNYSSFPNTRQNQPTNKIQQAQKTIVQNPTSQLKTVSQIIPTKPTHQKQTNFEAQKLQLQSQNIKNQPTLQFQKPPAVTPQQETQPIVTHHQVPKPPVKQHHRNPPPPPPLSKKNIPQNIEPQKNESQPVKEQNLFIQKPAEFYQHLNNVKHHPAPLKPQVSSDKSSKHDDKSFAPPSTLTAVEKFDTVEQKRIPPPPPSRSMKELLNKKLSSNKNIPRPPQRVQQQVQRNESENSFGFDREQNWGQSPSIDAHNNLKSKNVEIDDEYNTLNTQQQNHFSQFKAQHNPIPALRQPVNPQRFISQWLNSPQMTLKQLLPEYKQVIELYCLNKHLSLTVSSTHSSFNPLMKQLIESFILNNTVPYTEEQKSTAESLCLAFFYSNPSQFSDLFLLILVKLGSQYLSKYQQALLDQFDQYLQKILMYKNILLPNQITAFVKFCLDFNMVTENNLLLFLILQGQNVQTNNHFLQYLSHLELQQLKNSISILAYCQLNLKNKGLIMLYLKTISSLEIYWVRTGMVQKILNHLKTIEIPQNLYQYTKQLKLKLLKSFESNGSTQTKYNQQQYQTPGSQQNNKDSGLFGYFNLNKAIDKIKTSTEKALGAVEKQKKPQQEQKKDEIIYDPIRKRYIINGQIPEDEDQPAKEESSEQKAKVPPPPPMRGTKPPPPLPGKKPGARITGNRYA